MQSPNTAGTEIKPRARFGVAAAAQNPVVALGELLMDASTENPQSGKSRKNKPTKLPSRKSTAKVKVSLMLTDDVDFRLTVHAAALKLDRSALANQLLDAALKRFVVQDRGRTEDADEGRGEEPPEVRSGFAP